MSKCFCSTHRATSKVGAMKTAMFVGMARSYTGAGMMR
jgi:hypothetical protein